MKLHSTILGVWLAALVMAGILFTGCASGTSVPNGKQRRAAIKSVQDWMTGTFRNRAQAKHSPGDYHDIRLVQVPIWSFREDGPWFYVEQAQADELDRPYRQRIYRLEIQSDGAVASQVFALPGNPLDYTAPWRGDGGLGGLRPDTLLPRTGCTVVLQQVDGNTFTGGIEGHGCLSDLRGAAYVSSDVTLRPDRIIVWDRGYDSTGKQVWGSTVGPYIFNRVSKGSPE